MGVKIIGWGDTCEMSVLFTGYDRLLAVSLVKILGNIIYITCITYLHYNDVIMSAISNHRRLDGSLNRLFRHRSRTTSKLRVTGLCKGNSTVTGDFPSQRASNAENVSIWLRHHGLWESVHTRYVELFSSYHQRESYIHIDVHVYRL